MEMVSSATFPVSLGSVVLESLPYSLDLECPVPWPVVQEDALNQDFPFPISENEESPEDFVIRRYLETLWLPDSIMPLHHFLNSLCRISKSSSSTQCLQSALKPLLLSVRATEEKYRQELPRILQDGEGAGEIEEMMMWYAWSREKFGAGTKREGTDAEEAWRKAWMEKLERREVQIQILLYFHILSLPASQPSTPSPKMEKRKRKQTHGLPSPVKAIYPLAPSAEAAIAADGSTKALNTDVDASLSMEDRLEFFMDRLSLWQLVASLNQPSSSQHGSSQPISKDQRDWMQIFCEDIVEALFKDKLPELCRLLRTKVFPHSPFSADSSDSESSLLPRAAVASKAKGKRPASPLRLQELDKPKPSQSRAGTVQPTDSCDAGLPQQHRSRSRSVSVSVEEVRARGANRGGVASSKNLFKGEVEMKRTASRGRKLFQPRPAESQGGNTKELTRQKSHTETLPSAANTKSFRPRSSSQPKGPKTLAMDTPIKKVIRKECDNDIEMGSPDELLLTSQPHWNREGEDDDDHVVALGTGGIFAVDTPIKRRFES